MPDLGPLSLSPQCGAATMDGPGRYDIAAVGRAVDVLTALTQIGPATLTAIAHRAGCTRTAAFRLLRTLDARGFVSQEGNGGLWRLGVACVRLRGAAEQQLSLAHVARPVMTKLATAAGENVYLRARSGLSVKTLGHHQAAPGLHVLTEPPGGGPLHAGCGRLLLAFAPAEVLETVSAQRLPRYTPETRTDALALSREMPLLRARGVLRAVGDLYPNVVSISAPVHDASDGVVAVLEVAANTWRVPERLARTITEQVIAAAQSLSRELGASVGG